LIAPSVDHYLLAQLEGVTTGENCHEINQPLQAYLGAITICREIESDLSRGDSRSTREQFEKTLLIAREAERRLRSFVTSAKISLAKEAADRFLR